VLQPLKHPSQQSNAFIGNHLPVNLLPASRFESPFGYTPAAAAAQIAFSFARQLLYFDFNKSFFCRQSFRLYPMRAADVQSNH